MSNGVLIETYWNVKKVDKLKILADYFVLIETYWNVKVKLFIPGEWSTLGINRNILECITQQNGLEINFWKEHIHIMKNVIPSSLFGREYGTDCI